MVFSSKTSISIIEIYVRMIEFIKLLNNMLTQCHDILPRSCVYLFLKLVDLVKLYNNMFTQGQCINVWERSQ